jgi:hypothetical protein
MAPTLHACDRGARLIRTPLPDGKIQAYLMFRRLLRIQSSKTSFS